MAALRSCLGLALIVFVAAVDLEALERRIKSLENWRLEQGVTEKETERTMERLQDTAYAMKNSERESKWATVEERLTWLEENMETRGDGRLEGRRLSQDSVSGWNRRLRDSVSSRQTLLFDAQQQDRAIQGLDARVSGVEKDLADMRNGLSEDLIDGLSDIGDLNEEADKINAKLDMLNQLIGSGKGGSGAIAALLGNHSRPGGKGRRGNRSTSDGWERMGCYEETRHRLLSLLAIRNDQDLTNEKCRRECSLRGFSVAGTKDGTECYCGSPYELVCADSARGRIQCTSPCAGDSDEVCGSATFLSVFRQPTPDRKGWVSAGCFFTGSGGRVLRKKVYGISGRQSMTNERCQEACQADGFTAAGTVGGDDCYCGEPAAMVCDMRRPDRLCRTRCTGRVLSDERICGGSRYLTAYELIQ